MIICFRLTGASTNYSKDLLLFPNYLEDKEWSYKSNRYIFMLFPGILRDKTINKQFIQPSAPIDKIPFGYLGFVQSYQDLISKSSKERLCCLSKNLTL